MKFNIITDRQKELRSELFSNEFQIQYNFNMLNDLDVKSHITYSTMIEEYQKRNQEILVELYVSQEYIDPDDINVMSRKDLSEEYDKFDDDDPIFQNLLIREFFFS